MNYDRSKLKQNQPGLQLVEIVPVSILTTMCCYLKHANQSQTKANIVAHWGPSLVINRWLLYRKSGRDKSNQHQNCIKF